MRDLLTMQEQLECLFGPATPGWVPAADLCEVADRYVLTLELPGLTREDVALEVRDNTLTLRGRRPLQGAPDERYQQLERGHGQFARSFRFEEPVSTQAVTADLADGVLTVVVPKIAPTAVRRIEIE